MENVLYEYSGYSFPLVLLIPLFLAIFGIIFLVHSDSLIIIRGMDREKLEKRKKAIRLFILSNVNSCRNINRITSERKEFFSLKRQLIAFTSIFAYGQSVS